MDNGQLTMNNYPLSIIHCPLLYQRYNPLVHWLALITAAATFPLIFMGGLVTSHQAGMSVPDWPNSWVLWSPLP